VFKTVFQEETDSEITVLHSSCGITIYCWAVNANNFFTKSDDPGQIFVTLVHIFMRIKCIHNTSTFPQKTSAAATEV